MSSLKENVTPTIHDSIVSLKLYKRGELFHYWIRTSSFERYIENERLLQWKIWTPDDVALYGKEREVGGC